MTKRRAGEVTDRVVRVMTEGARSALHWMTEAGMFFEKKGPVWEALRNLESRLSDAGIDYVVIGGLAVNAHGHRRQTVDVDVVVSAENFEAFRRRYEGSVYQRTAGAPRRFRDPESEATVDFLIAGEIAGHRKKNKTVRFPDPRVAEEHDGLRTVSLRRLVELKLVTWRFGDWGDVVALIRENKLDESFGQQLDASVQSAYLQCCDQAHDPAYGPM